jgi:hypothetical protein
VNKSAARGNKGSNNIESEGDFIIGFCIYYSVQNVSDLEPGKQSFVSGRLQYLIPFKVGPS